MTLIESLPSSASPHGHYREAAESCKREGNKHFAAKDFALAIKCYDEAIAIDASSHILFGNRSAAYAGNNNWSNAVADARASVELNSGYTKGFYRLAQAYIGLGDMKNAAAAINSGLIGDPANKDMLRLAKKIEAHNGAVKLKTVASKSRLSRDRDGSDNESVSRAGGAKPRRAVLEKLNLYDDKDGPEKAVDQKGGQEAETQTLRNVFRSLRDSVNAPGGVLGSSGRPHELEGVFHRLTNPDTFRRIVTSGLSEEEQAAVPRTFQELLRNPLYSTAVEESLPKVVAQAASVLEGVKERGRKVGDTMDPDTEETLRPQILQEAFARMVLDVVSAVHARTRAQAVMAKAELALPDDDLAPWDQLEECTVSNVLSKGRGFAVQDNFLCEDGWDPAFLNDCSRFGAEAGRLAVDATMGATRGEMAWVEPDAALESTFPALHELLLTLHALAYELNHKAPGLSLARPCRGSTMLLRLREGCRLPAQLDSRVNGAPTGHKISCVYFVGCCNKDGNNIGSVGGHFKLQNVENPPVDGLVGERETSPILIPRNVPRDGRHTGESTASDMDSAPVFEGRLGIEAVGRESAVDRNDNGDCVSGAVGGSQNMCATVPSSRCQAQSALVEPAADRLVLYRSDRVSAETLEVLGGDGEQYAVRFWMHTTKGVREGEDSRYVGDYGSLPKR